MGNSVIYRPAYDAEVEYLESNDNSYIDTGLKASSELGILAHIYVTGIFPFGGRNGLNNKEFSFCARQQDGYSGFRFGSGGVLAQGERVNELYEFDNTQNHNILKVGNTTYVAPYNSFISDYNVFLFGLNNAGAVNFSSSRIYDFKIYQNSTLVRDYIPVRIGSVGYMYDKVSKQIFANKGTGNFILGNDIPNAVIPQQRCVLYFGNQRSVIYERIYEEYEWLVAEIPPQSVLMTIGIGNVFNYSRIYESIGNSSHLITNGYNYYTSSPSMVSIGVWNGSQNVENKAVNFTNGLNVVCTQDKLTFNSVEFSKYAFPASLRWNNSARTGETNTVVKTSSITVDGSVRYVPCKLTHGIPASMDANGIARPSGECGMWDTVNDVFYGNVASSGSFTVSND